MSSNDSFIIPKGVNVDLENLANTPGAIRIMNDETNPKDRLGVLKPRLSLVPPASILYEALAMEDGANKYGPYNWREKKVKLSIYIDACKRHLDSYWDGEDNAKDSGKPHLAHAKACLGIIIDALETGNLINDRPIKGPMSDLIDRFTKKKAV